MKPQSRLDVEKMDVCALYELDEELENDPQRDPELYQAVRARTDRCLAEAARQQAAEKAAAAAAAVAEATRLRQLTIDKEGLQYDPEIADELLEHIAAGGTLKLICEKHVTFLRRGERDNGFDSKVTLPSGCDEPRKSG
jgi:hypothetical protein